MTDPYDEALADLKALVDTHGWAIRHVLGGPSGHPVPFSYTVGLTGRGWAELIITGLPDDIAGEFLVNAVDYQKSHGELPPGHRTSALTESGEVALIRVEDTSAMTAVSELVGEFRALQIIWPDSSGYLPWQVGYRNAPTAQPILGSIPEE